MCAGSKRRLKGGIFVWFRFCAKKLENKKTGHERSLCGRTSSNACGKKNCCTYCLKKAFFKGFHTKRTTVIISLLHLFQSSNCSYVISQKMSFLFSFLSPAAQAWREKPCNQRFGKKKKKKCPFHLPSQFNFHCSESQKLWTDSVQRQW